MKKAKKARPLRRAAVSLLLGLVLALAVVPLSAQLYRYRESTVVFGRSIWPPTYTVFDHGWFEDDRGRLHRWLLLRDIGVRSLYVLREPEPSTEQQLFGDLTRTPQPAKPIEARLGSRGLWQNDVPTDPRLNTVGFGWPLPVATSVAINDPTGDPNAYYEIPRAKGFESHLATLLSSGAGKWYLYTMPTQPKIYWLALILNTLTYAAFTYLLFICLPPLLHRRSWVAHRRQARGRCAHCDYDLTKIAPQTPCPECGHVIDDRDEAAPV